MGDLVMLVRIEVHEGRADDLLRIFDEWFQQFEREPGTELFTLNRDPEHPNVFWCFEIYRDEAALQDHLKSETLARTLTEYRPLVANQQVYKLDHLRMKIVPQAFGAVWKT